ncbi:hypothetical protein B0H13DRAFT_2342739 [Mycena leptocephala]|nr:hypothetical protein B0H13DRAFT_2342739 [Mycena leptocephala]
MSAPFSLTRSFIVSIWLEGVIYGFFVCIFGLSLMINLGTSKRQTAHSRAMFTVGIITFILATIHIAINCMRMMRGYVDHGSLLGGPLGFSGSLSLLVLWSRKFPVVRIPFLMVFGSAVSGYMTCVIFSKIQPGTTVFDGSLDAWVKTFYSLAVAQNIITTTLMAWRIAATDKQSSFYRVGQGNLIPILRILVESAALYLAAEIILLILYACNSNAQFIALEAITPIIGITFNAITIRITLRSQISSTPGSQITADSHRPTIGSIPLRHIAVNIMNTRETDYDLESQSGKAEVVMGE